MTDRETLRELAQLWRNARNLLRAALVDIDRAVELLCALLADEACQEDDDDE